MPSQPMRPSNNTNDVALFDGAGRQVTLVTRPEGVPPDIIQWGSRYFIRRHGMYAEGTLHLSTEEQR
jgi:hypothetical protein